MSHVVSRFGSAQLFMRAREILFAAAHPCFIEFDLLLEFGPGRLWAVEVKRSLNPQPAKGFHLACDDVKATHRFVVYPGKERYRLDASTEAVPLSVLLREAAL